MVFKLSFCTGVYEKIPMTIEDIASRLAKFGYDGIEIAVTTGTPRRHAFPDDLSKEARRKLREVIESYGLAVAGLHRVYPPDVSIIHPSRKERERSVHYTNKVSELASDIGAKVICIGLRNQPSVVPYEDSWKWMVDSLRQCGEWARDVGVVLGIEPLNRYEAPFLHRLDEAVRMVEEISMESVKVLCDTFQMNIEERSFTESIRMARRHLAHVHIADSNREAPGRGHIDFHSIVQLLGELKYDGYLSMEIVPIPNPDTCDISAKESIEYIKRLITISVKPKKLR